MSTVAEIPDHQDQEMFLNLLNFFSRPSSEQITMLNKYATTVAVNRRHAHTNNPIIDLAEALIGYCRRVCYDTAAIPDQAAAMERLEEIEALLNLILERDAQERTSSRQLVDSPHWRIVRRLCADTQNEFRFGAVIKEWPLWNLLCMVSD